MSSRTVDHASLTRRQFTRNAVAAGTMMLTAHRVAAQDTPKKAKPNERMRAAVLGCRNRGWKVAQAFYHNGSFDIPVICDPDDAMIKIAMEHVEPVLPNRPKVEKDFRRILDDKSIDAIIVATPDHWHALMTCMALDAGKHVYLEKPASFNIDDGKAMVHAQKKHPDLAVLVGTQQRSGQHFKDAAEFIQSGGIGRVGFARAWLSAGRHLVQKVPNTEPPKGFDYDMWVGPAAFEPYNEQRVHYNWHFMKNFGTGDAGNWGAHWLDVVRWFCKADVPVSAMGLGGRYEMVKDEKEWPDTQTVLYEFPDFTAVWELRHWTNMGINERATAAEFRGDKGSVVIDRGGWEVKIGGGQDAKWEKHPTSQMQEPHVQNFVDCIRGHAKPASGIEEGHKTAILCHLANISTVLDRKVEFDPVKQVVVNDPEAAAFEGREYRDPWKMPRIG